MEQGDSLLESWASGCPHLSAQADTWGFSSIIGKTHFLGSTEELQAEDLLTIIYVQNTL